MEPPLLGSPKPDSCQQPPIRDNVMQVVSRKGVKRRVQFEEDLSVRRVWTARLQIVDQSLAHFAGQRQAQWKAGFRLRDFYCRIFPMNLIQLQSTNVSNTHPQPACQQENGVIAFTFRRTAIHRLQKPDDELVLPN